jgi:methionyl-tRNA formyltransferase
VALRIVFCGTPGFAVPSLQRLIAERDFESAGVVTQPDRPRGRGQEIHSSPVKDVAVAAGIPVYQPVKIKSEESYEYFKRLAPDAVVIIAYGQIISQRLIDIPRLGWINLHASLLPKYRGAAPINWAILSGETRTGLTTMLIDAGLDTGPTLLRREAAIGADMTAPQLTSVLSEKGAPLVVETLEGLNRAGITPVPQDHTQATFAPPLKKEDGRIDWSLGAGKIYNRIRGLQPWPGAFTSFLGKRCNISGTPLPAEGLESGLNSARGNDRPPFGTIVTLGSKVVVYCGDLTWLQLEFVQLEGRRRVSPQEFVRGAELTSGGRFGT